MTTCRGLLACDCKHLALQINVTGLKFTGEPFRFQVGVGDAIKGFDEGLQFIRKGEVATLTITGTSTFISVFW